MKLPGEYTQRIDLRNFQLYISNYSPITKHHIAGLAPHLQREEAFTIKTMKTLHPLSLTLAGLVRRARAGAVVLLTTLATTLGAAEILPENALFLAAGQRGDRTPESYVVSVSGSARIAEIRQYLAERSAGTEWRPLIASCTVRLGADGPNRNYSQPGAPVWGWQVAEYHSVRRASLELELYVNSPGVTGSPSDIEAQLRMKPSGIPNNLIMLVNFPIVMELSGEAPRGNIANVSDRGFAGTGDNAKITGFVVDGTAPRSVVVRVLGPSLAKLGVPGSLANPRMEIYRGTEKIAENDDWPQGNLNRMHIAVFPPPSPFHLVPTDSREPALELSLPPGAYTVIVTGANGSTGVVLTEVHTL